MLFICNYFLNFNLFIVLRKIKIICLVINFTLGMGCFKVVFIEKSVKVELMVMFKMYVNFVELNLSEKLLNE